jgi:hypothetical protein
LNNDTIKFDIGVLEMKIFFVNPLKKLLYLMIIGLLGFLADINELTNFNIYEWVKVNYPQSLVYIILVLLVVYLCLVVFGLITRKAVTREEWRSPSQQSDNGSVTQKVISEKIEGSSIKFAGRDLNENAQKDKRFSKKNHYPKS